MTIVCTYNSGVIIIINPLLYLYCNETLVMYNAFRSYFLIDIKMSSEIRVTTSWVGFFCVQVI